MNVSLLHQRWTIYGFCINGGKKSAAKKLCWSALKAQTLCETNTNRIVSWRLHDNAQNVSLTGKSKPFHTHLTLRYCALIDKRNDGTWQRQASACVTGDNERWWNVMKNHINTNQIIKMNYCVTHVTMAMYRITRSNLRLRFIFSTIRWIRITSFKPRPRDGFGAVKRWFCLHRIKSDSFFSLTERIIELKN